MYRTPDLAELSAQARYSHGWVSPTAYGRFQIMGEQFSDWGSESLLPQEDDPL